jgi:glycosyltransferase involved in cell wall biosynthesis
LFFSGFESDELKLFLRINSGMVIFHADMKLKITYFSYLYDIKGVSAGSANKAVGFIGGLNAIGHDATIFWQMDQPEDHEGESVRHQIRRELKSRLYRVIHDPKRILKNIPFFFREWAILRREKPDILFLRSELYVFSAALVARLMGIPIVLEVDSPVAYEYRHRSGRDIYKLPLLPEWIERWNWKCSRCFIAISDVLKAYMVEQGVRARHITVIPNGADPHRFHPGIGGKRVRSRLGIHSGAVVVGWAGSLFGWSGLENLLDMTKRILSSRKDVVFLFVGGGRNQQIIKNTFSPRDLNGRVFVTGTVSYDDVPLYIDAMDVVVVPYPRLDFWYPSSMKLFEYMSAGKALVASEVEQVKDVVQNGENGFLFNPDRPDTFTQKVLHLVDNRELRRKMGRNARKTVLEHYTWMKHAQKMELIFLNHLKPKRDDHQA